MGGERLEKIYGSSAARKRAFLAVVALLLLITALISVSVGEQAYL